MPRVTQTSNVGNAFAIQGTLDEAGTVYAQVRLSGSAAPSSADLVNDAGTFVSAASWSVTGGGEAAANISITGLTSETDYDIYFVGRDSAGNVQTSPTLVEERTADITPPSFRLGYPRFTGVRGTSALINFDLNEIGKVHFVLVPASATAPTASEVMALTASGGADATACGTVDVNSQIAGTTRFSATRNVTSVTDAVMSSSTCEDGAFYGLSGESAMKCSTCVQLSESTAYKVYFVAEDDESTAAYYRSNNAMVTPLVRDVTMADNQPPTSAAGYPKIDSLGTQSFEVLFKQDEIGKAYYFVVDADDVSSSRAPTKDEILSQGATYAGVTVAAKGVVNMLADTESTSGTLTFPMDGATYNVYHVSEDDGDVDTATVVYAETSSGIYSVLSVPETVSATLLDGAAPVFTSGYPLVDDIAGDSLVYRAEVDENSTLYWVIQPAGDAAPTAQEIKTFSPSGLPACGSDSAPSGSTHTFTIASADPNSNTYCDDDFYGLTGTDQKCYVCKELESETNYVLYVVAEDSRSNLQTAASAVPFRTTDVTPPTFPATPTVNSNAATYYTYLPNEGGVTLEMKVRLDEGGTVYIIAVGQGEEEPTVAQVKAGANYTDSGGDVVHVLASAVNAAPDSSQDNFYNITGLPASNNVDQYVDIYLVAEDDESLATDPLPSKRASTAANNLQTSVTKVTQLTADIDPPSFLASYPAVQPANVLGNQVDIDFKLDEPGTVMAIAVPVGFVYNEGKTDGTARALPTTEEVFLGQLPGGASAISSSASATGPTVEDTVSLYGLSPQTAYDVYVVARDDSHATSPHDGENNQTSIVKIEVTTRDVTAPTIRDTSFTVGGESIAVSVELNEIGFFHAVVLSQNASAPTAGDVRNGRGLNNADIAHGSCLNVAVTQAAAFSECTISGLPTETALRVYVTAEDTVESSIISGDAYPSSNLQDTLTLYPFTTKDITPPTYEASPYVTSYTPQSCTCTVPAGACCDIQLTIGTRISEVGRAYYVVLDNSAATPTALQVRMGSGALESDEVHAYGVWSLDATGSGIDTVNITGLKPETPYKVYVASQDDGPDDDWKDPNVQQSVQTISIETPDVSPPLFVGHYTSSGAVDDVTGSDLSVVVQLDEPGYVYYIIVPKDTGSPSADSVKSYYDGSVTADAVVCGRIAVTSASTNFTSAVTSVDYAVTTACDTTPSSYYSNTGQVHCVQCPRLVSETAYDVWLVAEDDGKHGIPTLAVAARTVGNLQDSATRVRVVNHAAGSPSVTMADVTAPTFVDKTINETVGTGFTLYTTLDEPGVVYYAAIESSASASATASQIRDCYRNFGSDGSYPLKDDADACGRIDCPEANVGYKSVVVGLETNVEYTIYLFAEDDEPNEEQQDRPVSWRQMTSLSGSMPNVGAVETLYGLDAQVTIDVAAPQFGSPSYPRVEAISSSTGSSVTTTFNLVSKLNEVGTVYYVVFEAAERGSGEPGSYAPSPNQVVACKDYQGNAAAICGSFGGSASANTEQTVTVPEPGSASLEDQKRYVVFLVAQDGSDGTNMQSEITKLELETADGSAPTFNPTFPRWYELNETHAILGVQTNEDATIHVMSIAANIHPSKLEVAAGALDSGASGFDYTSANYSTSTRVDGVMSHLNITVPVTSCASASTHGCAVYVATEDSAGNVGDGDVARTSALQATRMAPYVRSFEVWRAEDSLSVELDLSMYGLAHYVLLKGDSDSQVEGSEQVAPAWIDPENIISGTDNLGRTPTNRDSDFADTSSATVAGSSAVFASSPFSGNLSSMAIGNLTRGTTYDLWVVTADGGAASGGTDYDETMRYAWRYTQTTPDYTAPHFQPSYPKVEEVKSESAVLVVKLDEQSTVYYLLQKGGAARPTATEVATYTGGDVDVVTHGSLSVTGPENDFSLYRVSDFNVTLTSLDPDTDYDLYVVAKDVRTLAYSYPGGEHYIRDPENMQASATKVVFRTPSDNAFIAPFYGLDASTGELSPTPAKEVYNYTVFVDESTTHIELKTIFDDLSASAKLNGASVSSGTASNRSLTYYKSTFEYVITAENALTSKSYYVDVFRGAAENTANSTLQQLELVLSDGTVLNSTAMGGASWPDCVLGCVDNSYSGCNQVNPECIMDSARLQYHAYIPAKFTNVTVRARAAQHNMASIQMYTLGTRGVHYPGGLPGWTTGVDHSVDNVVDLDSLSKNGGNTIDLIVTAGDAVSTTRYTILIDRYGPGVYEESGWGPVYASPSQFGVRYDERYAGPDGLTTKVPAGPGVKDLTRIPKLDITPPEFMQYNSTVFPFLSSVASSGATLHLQLNEPGSVYYVVLPDAARRPTVREVLEPELRSDALTSGTVTDGYGLTREYLHPLSGLSSSTSYDVYLVAEDLAENLKLEPQRNSQTSVTKIDITTAA